MNAADVADWMIDDAIKVYESKEERFGAQTMRDLERWVLLRTLDSKWRDHLYEMDYLREGIGLRALAQINPLVAYKNEGYDLFQQLMESIQSDFVRYLYHLEITQPDQPKAEPTRRGLAYSGGGDASLAQNFAAAGAEAARDGRISRQLRRGVSGGSAGHAYGGGPTPRHQSRPQRALSLRERQETQKLLRLVGPTLGQDPGRGHALSGAMLRPQSHSVALLRVLPASLPPAYSAHACDGT